MLKYFLFLSIILSTSSFIIGMNNNIPKIAIPTNTTKTSAHPTTPRNPNALRRLPLEEAKKYPSFQAFCFIEAINHQNLPIVSDMINNKHILNGYPPAIAIRDTLVGTIQPHSPFYNKKTWQEWKNNKPINKKQYAEMALRMIILQSKIAKTNEEREMFAKRFIHIASATGFKPKNTK